MIVARYFVLFIVFSVAGWLWECTFRVVRDHHWQNRGFLYGPLCPIYGTGAVLAMRRRGGSEFRGRRRRDGSDCRHACG